MSSKPERRVPQIVDEIHVWEAGWEQRLELLAMPKPAPKPMPKVKSTRAGRSSRASGVET